MTAKEATKQLMDMGCKYLRIVSVDGDVIVYQNPAKDSSPSATKAQADKISLYVSKAPEGTYVIQGLFKTSHIIHGYFLFWFKGRNGVRHDGFTIRG